MTRRLWWACAALVACVGVLAPLAPAYAQTDAQTDDQTDADCKDVSADSELGEPGAGRILGLELARQALAVH